jgi:PhnB protein
MARTPPEGSPRITPYLLYEDCAKAIDWLTEAFGFREVLRATSEEGVVTHAELRLEDGTVFVGHPGPDYRSPKSSGHRSALTHVYVEDVDAHCEQARRAGAEIVTEPHEPGYGDRRYDAEDLEGQLWSFATHLETRAPEGWGATAAG